MPDNRKIIFMDDDDSLYRVIEFMMARLGYGISFTKNGEETIAVYQDAFRKLEPFSAIILDVNVNKGMGGGETIQKLHAIDHYVKAIVSSGDTYDPLMINYYKNGFAASISKPYDFKELKMVLSKVINGKYHDSICWRDRIFIQS
jgi:DNA-binding NtrC family response regulator